MRGHALVRSVRDGRKAAAQEQKRLVTAGLRGEDYLPPEVLNQLPPPSAISTSASRSDPAPTRAERRAAERRAKHLERVREPQDGLPQVVQKSYAIPRRCGPSSDGPDVLLSRASLCSHCRETVEVAVLPASSRVAQPRMHAPVRDDVKDFLQNQLYGGRHKRVPAATLSSLKASGGKKFTAASNFASVPLSPQQEEPARKKRKRNGVGGSSAGEIPGRSTLEQMAARIMRRGRS